jgi:hypothetical protein
MEVAEFELTIFVASDIYKTNPPLSICESIVESLVRRSETPPLAHLSCSPAPSVYPYPDLLRHRFFAFHMCDRDGPNSFSISKKKVSG